MNANGGTALLALLILLLGWSGGCSRQPGVMTTSQNTPGGQGLPFATSPVKGGDSPTAFFPTSNIPVGTLFTVRIMSEISSGASHPGDRFEAVLEDPATVEGEIVAPTGTKLVGKVLAAKASSGPQDPGYLRLILTGISLEGKSRELQSSSIFVKGGSREQKGAVVLSASNPQPVGNKKDVKFPAEWRLTFRLTQALSLPSSE